MENQQIEDFRTDKMTGYLNKCYEQYTASDPAFALQNWGSISAFITDVFSDGFDYGLDAYQFQEPTPQPAWLTDPDALLDLVQKIFEKAGKARYSDEDKPTPEQLKQYEIDNYKDDIFRTAFRLLEISDLYSGMIVRQDAIELAIQDAIFFKQKLEQMVI